MKFCDLHTHILPGVDDGAQNMEDALQMLRNAAASDVELVAVTPHCNRTCEMRNCLDDGLRERFLQLQQAARDIPVRLVSGAEAFADDDLLQLLRGKKIATINDTRYLLTEFPTDTIPEVFQDMLQGILQLGYIPLVAHPERYSAVCQMP